MQVAFNETSCADVAAALKKAGDAMSNFDCTGPKGNGEKCGYSITTATSAHEVSLNATCILHDAWSGPPSAV